MTHRLHVLLEELVVHLVHGCKVFHGRQEDVDLEHVFEATARGFQNGSEVLQCSSLYMLQHRRSDQTIGGTFPSTCHEECLTVSFFTPPSTRVNVAGSKPMLPEQ